MLLSSHCSSCSLKKVLFSSKSTAVAAAVWLYGNAGCNGQDLVCTIQHCITNVLYSAALQIVVLAGGTNDFHAAPPPQDQWTSDNLNFISEVGLWFLKTKQAGNEVARSLDACRADIAWQPLS